MFIREKTHIENKQQWHTREEVDISGDYKMKWHYNLYIFAIKIAIFSNVHFVVYSSVRLKQDNRTKNKDFHKYELFSTTI